LRRALAKTHLRLAALDDGAFSRRQSRAPLVAVVWSAPDEIEGVCVGSVEVDGRDATACIAALVRTTRQFEGVRGVLLDGITFGGFNVVDLDRLHRDLRLPIVAVTRGPPQFDRIRAALRKYFPRDAAVRWRRLRQHRLFTVPTGARPILATAVGCTRADAVAVVRRATRRGHWPEPLRLAHLIAHAVGTREPPRVGNPGSARTLKARTRVPKSGPVA
jgi:uncharacterized protein